MEKRMYKELENLYKSDEYPLHMPGHKRKDGCGQIAYEIDITEIEGYDDLYNPTGIIKEALSRAAKLYDVDKTYFLVNGSTVGILTAMFAVTNQSGNILMARNCHKSVYHGAELRQLNADYIDPEQKNGIFERISKVLVEQKLKDNKYEAVIITSPTYEGYVSDIKEIADICHAYNTPLIVDEAHGAHFIYSQRFPESAVKYADVVIQSTHKTLPALTQTALMHINSKLVSVENVDKYLQMFQTSSPSYVLMSSIDSCISSLAHEGEHFWDDFFDNVKEFREKVKNLNQLSLIETDDPCKIVISTVGTSINGPSLSKTLLEKYHLQMEMASATYDIAIVTCNDTKEGFDRLARALLEIDAKIQKSEQKVIDIAGISHLLNTKAKDYIYIYPPGIPIAVPGQIIDENILNTIGEYLQAGLKVRGL